MTHYYFAYGSNLSVAQMHQRCPDAVLSGFGCLRNYRLDFTHYSKGWECGVADIVRSEGENVCGLVYLISESDLASLDQYEGYPDVFDRVQETVWINETSMTGVWVYSVREKQKFIAPSVAYLRIILDAALEYSFPAQYREFLKTIPAYETRDLD